MWSGGEENPAPEFSVVLSFALTACGQHKSLRVTSRVRFV